MQTHSSINLYKDFLDMLSEQSSYKGEPSVAYQVGFLRTTLEDLLYLPEVQDKIEMYIHYFKQEQKSNEHNNTF